MVLRVRLCVRQVVQDQKYLSALPWSPKCEHAGTYMTCKVDSCVTSASKLGRGPQVIAGQNHNDYTKRERERG